MYIYKRMDTASSTSYVKGTLPATQTSAGTADSGGVGESVIGYLVRLQEKAEAKKKAKREANNLRLHREARLGKLPAVRREVEPGDGLATEEEKAVWRIDDRLRHPSQSKIDWENEIRQKDIKVGIPERMPMTNVRYLDPHPDKSKKYVEWLGSVYNQLVGKSIDQQEEILSNIPAFVENIEDKRERHRMAAEKLGLGGGGSKRRRSKRTKRRIKKRKTMKSRTKKRRTAKRKLSKKRNRSRKRNYSRKR